MGRKIRWTLKANFTYNNILSYIQNKFGNLIVQKFVKRTHTFQKILSEFPQIGTVEDKNKGIFAYVLEKQVTVFYRYTDKEIIILNFFINRKNPQKRKG